MEEQIESWEFYDGENKEESKSEQTLVDTDLSDSDWDEAVWLPPIHSEFDSVNKLFDRVLQEFIELNHDSANISELKPSLQLNYHDVKFYKQKWDIAPEEKIQKWSRSRSPGFSKTPEIIAVVNRALQILTEKELTISQVLCLLILGGKSSASYGQFCEMLPGEGQATVVTTLAIIKIFLGMSSVDVICSTEELATATVHQFAKLYRLFGNTVAVNELNTDCNNVPESKIETYKAEVIYGTIRSFQLDYLHDISTGSGLRRRRGFGAVIVDDSCGSLFEDHNLITNLSICKDPCDVIVSIRNTIWQNLQVAEELWVMENSKLIIEKRKELLAKAKIGLPKEDFILEYNGLCNEVELTTYEQIYTQTMQLVQVYIPCEDISNSMTHLSRLAELTRNAMYAKYLIHKGMHYVVEEAKEFPKVVPNYDDIAKSRSDIGYKFQDYHPFLQLKENLKIQSPSSSNCRISTYGFLNLYAPSIAVVTEIQRSVIERDYIETIHKLEGVRIPRITNFDFQELPAIVMPDQHWVKVIAIETNQKAGQDRQAVLIICKTYKECKDIENCLELTSKITFKEYTNSMVNVRIITEENLQEENNKELSPEDIVITTDDVARQLRLKMSASENPAKGLHVCVGFCPNSERHKQVLFHNALLQPKGTAQIIVRLRDIPEETTVAKMCTSENHVYCEKLKTDSVQHLEASNSINQDEMAMLNLDYSDIEQDEEPESSSEASINNDDDELKLDLDLLNDPQLSSPVLNKPIQSEKDSDDDKISFCPDWLNEESLSPSNETSNAIDAQDGSKEYAAINRLEAYNIIHSVREILEFLNSESELRNCSNTDVSKYFSAFTKHFESQLLENDTRYFPQILDQDRVFHSFWKNYYFEKTVDDNVNTRYEVTEIPTFTAPSLSSENLVEDNWKIIGCEVMKLIDNEVLKPVLEDLKDMLPIYVKNDINEHAESFLDVALVGGVDVLSKAIIGKFNECSENVWTDIRKKILKDVRERAEDAPEAYLERHDLIPWRRLSQQVGALEMLLKTKFKVIQNALEEDSSLSTDELLQKVAHRVIDAMTYMANNPIEQNEQEQVPEIKGGQYKNTEVVERDGLHPQSKNKSTKYPVVQERQCLDAEDLLANEEKIKRLQKDMKLKFQFSEEISLDKLKLAYFMALIKLKEIFEHWQNLENGCPITRNEDVLEISNYVERPIILECEETGITFNKNYSELPGEPIQIKCRLYPSSFKIMTEREKRKNHENNAAEEISGDNQDFLDVIAEQTGKPSQELREHLISSIAIPLSLSINWHRKIQLNFAALLGGIEKFVDYEGHLLERTQYDDLCHAWDDIVAMGSDLVSLTVIQFSENNPNEKQALSNIMLGNIEPGHSVIKHSSESAGEKYFGEMNNKKKQNMKKLTTFKNEEGLAKALISSLKIIPCKALKFPNCVACDFEVHVKVSELDHKFEMCEFSRVGNKNLTCKKGDAQYITMVLGYHDGFIKKIPHIQTIFPRFERPPGILEDEAYKITFRVFEGFQKIIHPRDPMYDAVMSFFSD